MLFVPSLLVSLFTLGFTHGASVERGVVDIIGYECTTVCTDDVPVPISVDACNDLIDEYADKGNFTVYSTSSWQNDYCQVLQRNRIPTGEIILYNFDRDNWAKAVGSIVLQCVNGGYCDFYNNFNISTIYVQAGGRP